MLGKRFGALLFAPFARFVPFALFVAAASSPSPAYAGGWQEMHETSDDVRVEIDSAGMATVTHHLRYRIVAGHYKTFDLVGVDTARIVDVAPSTVLTSEKSGLETAARVEPLPLAKSPNTLRILVDESVGKGKGLTRGAYVVDVKYKVDLVATKMLMRDGAMWKVAWTAPPAPEGHDGARVIFEIPTAPTEPRLAGAAESATTLTTLRRSTERDELELVRAHVPRGEAVTWAARIDPKAFPRVTSPDLRPPPPTELAPPSAIASNLSRVIVAAGFAILTGLLVLLLRTKQNAVREAAEMKRAKARPLIPLPWGTGPFVYGVVTSASLASLLWWNPIAGALMVSAAMALAAHRAPSPIPFPRRPGEWRTVSDQDVLLPPRAQTALPTDALDFGTTRGKLCLLLVAVLLGGLGYALRMHIPQIAIAVPLVAVALVPIFVTGTRAQMSESPINLAARILRPTRDLIARSTDLTHIEIAPLARTTKLTGEIDEVRLSCTPRDRMPGLKSIEVAIASSGFAQAALPEVLVRFGEQTSAADRLARITPKDSTEPPVVGRAADERVLRLIPSEPTARATAALVSELMMALEGRRATDHEGKSARTAWRGPERRGARTSVLVPA